MSAGFPNRVTRDDFGPDHQDAFPVEHPELQRPASEIDLLLWQATGAQLMVSRAQLEANWNGTSFDILYQQEAWNPKATVAHPTLTRVGTGVYTYEFLTSYPDGAGNSVSTVIRQCHFEVRKVLSAFADRLIQRAWIDPADPLVVQMRIWDSSGTLVDAPFWLGVL